MRPESALELFGHAEQRLTPDAITRDSPVTAWVRGVRPARALEFSGARQSWGRARCHHSQRLDQHVREGREARDVIGALRGGAEAVAAAQGQHVLISISACEKGAMPERASELFEATLKQ